MTTKEDNIIRHLLFIIDKCISLPQHQFLRLHSLEVFDKNYRVQIYSILSYLPNKKDKNCK